jgi:hypothetical protein
VGAPGVGQVALGAAVLEPEAGRVAHPRRGDRVPDEDDLAAALEQSPQRLGGRRRRGEREEERD